MNSSPADDVATLLVNEGITIFGNPAELGVNLFVFEWGEGQDIGAQILLMDSSGIPEDQSDQFEQPFIQILARGKKAKGGKDVYDNIKNIRDFLLTQPVPITIDSTDYNSFQAQSGIGPLGKDENNRYIYSTNLFTYRNSF